MLTKTDFLEYLRCPREFWLKHHSPELFAGEISLEHKHRREEGYEVQRHAFNLGIFKVDPERFHIEHERVFSTADLYAKSDIVVTDKVTGSVQIYEVKSASRVKPDHIDDVVFQKNVAEATGCFVSHVFVITVNSEYRRNSHIDPDRLLTVTDVTDQVIAKQAAIVVEIQNAVRYLTAEPEPSLHEHCSEKLDCTFIRQHFPDLPEYTVFNISRLSPPKLRELLDQNIVDIRHVPADFQLSEKQRRQVDVACCGEPFIDAEGIRAALAGLRFPLRFLDYETFGHAVPQFSGVRPHQQMVFQYSLHTLAAAGAQPDHCFHLSRNDGAHPAHETAESLRAAMSGSSGTVIVWHAGFETGRNRELGEMLPGYREFFDDLNVQVFDLETIFTQQLYVHAGFRGRTSIKNVLPVLCPLLSYDHLSIAGGMSASINWYHMATRRHPEDRCTRIYDDLCKYCQLDTLAMLEIYELLAAI